jgi:hypothetical protein
MAKFKYFMLANYKTLLIIASFFICIVIFATLGSLLHYCMDFIDPSFIIKFPQQRWLEYLICTFLWQRWLEYFVTWVIILSINNFIGVWLLRCEIASTKKVV